MIAREFQLQVRRSAIAFVRAWLPEGQVRGVVQIIHGMAEHSGRYARLAQALTAAGYAVYAQDLPAHGRTARAPDELGVFTERSGWRLALQSIRLLQQETREWHPDAPQFLFGHSMGSFLLQDYLGRHAQGLRGAVLSASSRDPGLERRIGLALVQAEALWGGIGQRSAVADLLTFRSYNRKFSPARTTFDWLSRDTAEVDRYIADPQCGFRCNNLLWIQLLQAIGRLDDAHAQRIPKDLALLIIAGEADPVSKGRRGQRGLRRHYADAGLRDISDRLYPKARHELLNDLCRDEVTADLLDWLGQRTLAASIT